jgi:hypothetical protein
MQIRGKPEYFRSFANCLFYCVLRYSANLKAEPHVFRYAQMRIERIVLKHHGDVPILGRKIVDQPSTDKDLSLRYAFQAGNHAQQCRLTAAGGPNKCHEFAIPNRNVCAFDDRLASITLFNLGDLDICHETPPFKIFR